MKRTICLVLLALSFLAFTTLPPLASTAFAAPAPAATQQILTYTVSASFVQGVTKAAITYKLKLTGTAVISITNGSGKLVSRYQLSTRQANTVYTGYWDGKATAGNNAGLAAGALCPVGTYKITLTAGSAQKYANCILKQALAAPTGVLIAKSGSNYTAQWNFVAHAASYVLQLYKNSVLVLTVPLKSTIKSYSLTYDLNIRDSGSYYIRLTAKGSTYYADSTKGSSAISFKAVNDGHFGGGTGTSVNPYKVSTAQHLRGIASYPKAYYIQTADINLSGVVFSPIAKAPAADAAAGYSFLGTYDGNGKKISNLKLYYPSNDYIGLFNYIGKGGVVKNLVMLNADITGGKWVGAIAGANAGTISNCSVTGKVSGLRGVGGITGFNDYQLNTGVTGVVLSCSNYSNVTAAYLFDMNGFAVAGGIAGYNYGEIMTCTNGGKVISYDTTASPIRADAGGITGYNIGRITKATNTGEVYANAGFAGGIVGSNDGIDELKRYGAVDACTNKSAKLGVASTICYVGGIAGNNYASVYTNCASVYTPWIGIGFQPHS